jgi:hypothetical protein
MIRLLDIVKEIEEDQIDISSLTFLDDEIKKALEDAPKNEIFGTIAFGLALPGIISAITKVIEGIAKKSGLRLEKEDPKWYQVIGKVAEKLDGYVDAPIRGVLKLFIKDQAKREKIAKIIKAVLLVMMAIYGNVDMKQMGSLTSLIKDLAPEISSELMQTIAQKNTTNIADILRPIFKGL